MASQRLLTSVTLCGLAVLVASLILSPTPGPATATGDNSITRPDTAGDHVGQYASLALDGAGNPVVSYYDEDNEDLKVLHCNDANCSDGEESITSPDTDGQVGLGTSLALDASGYPVVSYYDATNFDLKVLHCNDAGCEGGDESITSPDTGGSVGQYPSLALDGAGNPVVSYYDATNEDLKVLHCNDANCEGGDESVTSPDTGGDVGYYTSLALDGAGNPVVSYHYATDFDLKVLHCNDPNCEGGDESVTSPETDGDVGQYTSLSLDGSGYPVVSYYDATNFYLKLLHCNDAGCSGGDESITSPDIGFQVGYYTSLALDASGYPVVSHYDAQNERLRLLHCTDPNCSGRDESITSPDTASFFGWDTSLALDASGYPVVAYYDDDNFDLKVLHCNDPGCAGKPATPTPTPAGLTGDANCSGTINSIDAALVLQFAAGLIASLSCQQNADANEDGTTNSIDAALILQFDAGLIDSLPPTPTRKVDVPHGEWFFTPSVDTVPAGTVTFNARNDGVVPHNFRLVRTDLAPDALPVDTETSMVDEGQLEKLARSEDLAAGEVEQIVVDLEPGSYVMFCNIPTHYQVGLYAGLTVE
jgi:uncharacterized cupredoxin-like copper-binding protein